MVYLFSTRFFPLFLFLFLSNFVQAQYKEIERTAVNEVIVVHCFKDKLLNISVDTGKGYRALANISEYGGQEVPHLHFHLFGGEKVGKMVE